MRRQLAGAIVLAIFIMGCGGSSSTPTSSTATSSPAVTAAQFGAAATRLWQSLKYADPTKTTAAALAAKFDGFGAAVAAQPAPPDEISARAAIVSAAHHAAAQINAAADSTAYGAAVGAAQATIGGLIDALLSAKEGK